eukprot:115374-Prorocentrum_lima.AAC.1
MSPISCISRCALCFHPPTPRSLVTCQSHVHMCHISPTGQGATRHGGRSARSARGASEAKAQGQP